MKREEERRKRNGMAGKLLITVLVPICTAIQVMALPSPAAAADVFGGLGGVTLDSASGQPVPSAQIVAHNVDNGTNRTAVSGANGAFAIDRLEPGHYEVDAVKQGFRKFSTNVQVAPVRTAQVDLLLAAADAVPNSIPSTTAASTVSVTEELEAMKRRIEQLEALLSAQKTTPPPEKVSPVDNSSVAGGFMKRPEPEEVASNAIPQSTAPGGQSAGAPGAQKIVEAAPAPTVDNFTPFADYDWTWLNGNPRNKDVAFDSKFFTPEIRADITYSYDFNKPVDDSMGGSSELFRSNEIQLEQMGLGGDFHWDNVRARFMTQFGEYSVATIRNDPSYAKGQWDIADADRYLSEAYGGYHINTMHGINIDAGIFMSYVGLFSYYNFDNWAYQPSYVSSNTPWFFEGIRIQTFPTHHLKIEPWIINGWQSYGSANSRKGLGGQIKYTPYPWLNILSNNYGLGHDDLYTPHRARIHTDNSVEIKYFDRPGNGLDKIALSFTGDLGCEFGGGVSCHGDTKGGPKQSFIGYMVYNRFWFHRDLFGFTLGGGQINNPGRYLVLLPPINGETAASAALNSPYFTENPGDPFKAWDVSGTFDYMPKQWLTFRFEGDYRHASVPYWSGAGGVTPPPLTNNGFPTQYACQNGNPSGQTSLSAATASCASNGGVWFPDLRRDETLFDIDLMVKF